MPFFYIVYVVICVLVVAIILFQDGKTGGLVSVADNNTVFGAKGASSFLTKVTSILVIAFFVLDMGLAYYGTSGESIAADHAPAKGTGEITLPEGEKPAGVTTDGTGQFENAETEVFTADELPEEVRKKLGEQAPAEKKDGEAKPEGDQKPAEEENDQ